MCFFSDEPYTLFEVIVLTAIYCLYKHGQVIYPLFPTF